MGVTACHGGPQGKHQVLARKQKQEEGKSLGQCLSWVSTGKARPGKVNSLGLASLNTSSGFGGIGALSSCMVFGPGMI